jgi:hypothetical protein
MKSRLALLIGLLWISFQTNHASPVAAPTNFTGHYELVDTKAEQSFSLDIEQTGSSVDLSFSAAMADGSGAAPDGDGKGKVNAAGVLTFTFKDSFANEGSGTMTLVKHTYHLKLDAAKVVEPRALRFYGDVLLHKTADKPQPQ